MTEEQQRKLDTLNGLTPRQVALANLLWDHLKKDRDNKDRRHTSFGTKTRLGLAASIERIFQEHSAPTAPPTAEIEERPEHLDEEDGDMTAYCPGCQAEEIETGYGRFEHKPGCKYTGQQWDDRNAQWVPDLNI